MTDTKIRGIYEGESISQALRAGRESSRIFISYGAGIEVYDEGLAESVTRYHPSYNPLVDDDPLLEFGATDGMLPGKTAEQTMQLRDVVMRYSLPHRNYYWNHLAQGIRDMAEIKLTREDLIARQVGPAIVYMLNDFHLEQFAQLSLAVHQVLSGLDDFRGKSGNQRFPFDPEWKILRLMEENLSRSAILMTCSSMQLRLERALQRITISLNAIKKVYGREGLDALSSMESTRDSVRSEFGQEEGPVELGKLLARPDYAAR
ncbi:hypothetical protein B0H15DRAFT_781894, partial [Mycena belliarum]